MAEVKLQNLEKTFSNGMFAVQGVNLDIKDGEFMVLVGPSGCAKSTTLRMIAGLEEISQGEVYIGGKAMKEIPPKERGIAMVFQNYALYPHLTVFENLAFGLKMAKVPKKEIEKRVKEVVKVLELDGYLNKKPKEMSGGQKQRVAVGRAMVRNPKVFLFDEPLSNLDAKLRVHMRVQITQLHQDLIKKGKKATMIYVTHDQVEAMTMGDRICVMNYGKIMQVDTPINLYEKPANKFVANFIGTPGMNLLKGEIVVKNEEVFAKISDSLFLLPKEKSKHLINYMGKKIWFGIRPEDISLNFSETFTEPLGGKVNIKEQMGYEAYIYFELSSKKQFIARVPADTELSYGKEHTFYLNMEKCHIFDFITEINLCI